MTTKFKHSSESAVILSQLMLPSHSNFGGKIHGGFILSLLDQVAFACASKHSENYCVTASVDRVDFLNPVEVGELLTLKSTVNYVGRTSMVVGVRVESEHIHDGSKKHCNSSYFTMVAKDESGKSAKVPGLKLKSEDDYRRFIKNIKRMENRKRHDEIFSNFEFDKKEYQKVLKDYNVIMK
ncbi:acyl-CoA thioesterase [Psychroflexus montanilacus]|uniref:acyl-CoA thioesterase n=1 Tax=Psychroflexus montanilacus TaxID=2873598 RepID=UPI001CCAA0BC|nr:acyl-CoA thioesterase [Psychroflexus montanilacus]MBZ9650429.1 acyl-CoA thioesterase [Psychroflexus montanilacus]